MMMESAAVVGFIKLKSKSFSLCMSRYSLKIISIVATIIAGIAVIILKVEQDQIAISFIANYRCLCSQRNNLTVFTCTKAQNTHEMVRLREYHKRFVSKTIAWKATSVVS